MRAWLRESLSRRSLLWGGAAAASGSMLGSIAAGSRTSHENHGDHSVVTTDATPDGSHSAHGNMITVGDVDATRNGFDPSSLLTDWDTGIVSALPDGRTLRTFEIIGEDKEIEIAPGILFPAWTYNGRVPGPSLRVTEGDRVRIVFHNNGSHRHSIHFHGIHSARMDGIPGAGEIGPGEEFTYEFDALPFGCHLYHCHSLPLKRHIHKGMYGAFVIDPDPTRHPELAEVARSRLLGTPENQGWQEFVMVMNAFDTNFDGENEVYAVNTVAHHYAKHPITVVRGKPVRIYLVNVVEFDPINSLHLHGNFFDYYDHGTTLTPTLRTVDTVMQCQAQRGIVEFAYRDHETGLYMFHAHQSEFTELGWMGMFDVVEAAA
ncbi:multicopper oxidase domain-containing protein [Microvirga sp. VF16]|uniref:multicopper oxidase domain-containing protein n=1 Tax=Microvirga sp. VF16 TaxID=2807101 RepID=UPI00193EA2A8|nr:multicopper oxidase domain-containing protein [Microvirga sp. VF16]QRM31607.1 multicopper oxidase domain-containing protein [Microvirga sp. VF16]